MRRHPRVLAAILCSLALLATACGSSGGDSASDTTAVEAAATTEDAGNDAQTDTSDDTGDDASTGSSDAASPAPSAAGDKPVPTLPTGAVTDLVIEDIVVGDGEEAVPGMMVEVHYVGVLACTGIEFDASWNRGQTFSFLLGGSQVIYGWDAGVEGMRVGGQRQLTIPSHQAYGERGSGSGSIGPGADLVFVVDLLSVTESDTEVTPREVPQPAPAPEAVPDKPVPTLPDGPVTELLTQDIVVGDGDVAEAGSLVEVHYVGVLACNGQEFDASWNRGDTFTFVLGAGGVIPGWDIGVEGMQVGGQRQLTIPFALAYGSAGSGPIPAGADLVFVVDLVGVSPAPVQPDFDFPASLSGELEIEDRVTGEGPEIGPDELVLLQFAVASYSTREQIDSSWASGGQPITMSTGDDAIPGIAQGLIGAQVGTVRQIVIPPELAFGAEGRPEGGIAPNETLIVIVEVVELFGPIGG